jgi:multidrug resistance efflux pump
MTIFSYAKKHSFLVSVFIIILIILAIIIGKRSNTAIVVETLGTNQKHVNLVKVSTFRQNSDFVSANGLVVSKGQADLKSVISAPVSVIHSQIGDSVYAGQVILELENSDLYAQLEQSQASLDLAKGQYSSSGVSLDSAKNTAVDKIRDSYIKGYEAVITQIDPLLVNNDGNGGKLTSIVADTTISNRIIDTRVSLTSTLRDWKILTDNLNSDSTDEEIISAFKVSLKNLNTIDKLLSDISQALNDVARYSGTTFTTFINTWKAVVSASRSSVSGSNAGLISAQSAFFSAGTSYGSTAQAQVSLAEAGVKNLYAQLAKTIIRSPINGKVASLPLGVGELASPSQILATVVGEDGLEIKAYASGEDINKIKVGAKVNIFGEDLGTVESVAPSVSNTNRKVEVKININETEPHSATSSYSTAKEKLVIGQNVQTLIHVDKKLASNSNENSSVYKLPIQDVKIIPGEAYVFTVDSENKIKKNVVILGELDGDFIQVKQGLTDDMNIVSPVYELDEGEVVVTE